MKIFSILFIINNAEYTCLCAGTDACSVGNAGGMWCFFYVGHVSRAGA